MTRGFTAPRELAVTEFRPEPGKALRVLAFVTDAFGGNGGIARYSRDLLTALCSCPGVQKVVAIPRLAPGSPEEMPIKLDFLSAATRGPLAYLAVGISALFRRGPYDIVYCGHINLLPIAEIAARLSGGELWLQLYGAEAWRSPGGRMRRRMLRRVTRVISISNFTLSRFRGWSGFPESRCFLLPNAIRLEDFGTGPRPTRLPGGIDVGGRTVLMTLGRLETAERAKGFDEMLELMPVLREEIPGALYVIAGDGNDRRRLEEKARALGVSSAVHFTGAVSEVEKLELFRTADVFVMPSRLEGFGFVFLEALACGVPVVASVSDGGREAVREGEWGVLVDPENPEDIIRGIREALKRPREVPRDLGSLSYGAFSECLRGFIQSWADRRAE